MIHLWARGQLSPLHSPRDWRDGGGLGYLPCRAAQSSIFWSVTALRTGAREKESKNNQLF